MLETILKWLGAGDQAIAAMGPLMTILFGQLGGFGFTQLFKFPLAKFVQDGWESWVIRVFAICSTWTCLVFLGDLPWMLNVIVALLQPWVYTLVQRAACAKWPWLEATWLGSARPSPASQEALVQKRMK